MRRRIARLLRGTAVGVAVFVVFVASFIAGLVLHLDTEVARRVVREKVLPLVEGALPGGIEVGRIETLTPWEVAIERVAITSEPCPEAVEVIDARGVAATFEPGTLVAGLVDGRVDLVFPEAGVDSAVVSLAESCGRMGIETAFVSADDGAPKNETQGASTPVTVRIGRARIGTAEVVAVPGLDIALASDVVGEVAVDGEAVDVTVRRARVFAEAAGRRAAAAVVGGLAVAPDGSLRASADLKGMVAGAATVAHADLDGERWRAAVHAVAPATAALPSARGHLVATARGAGTFDAFAVAVDLAQLGAGAPVRHVQISGQMRVRPEAGLAATLGLTWSHLDVSALVDGPSTDLTGRGEVGLTDLAGPSVSFGLDLEETTIAGRPVPSLAIDGTYRDGGGWLEARLGANAGTVSAHARREGGTVAADIAVDGLKLSAVPVDIPLGGRVDATIDGRLQLDPPVLEDLDVDLQAPTLRIDDARVRGLEIQGQASGALDNPTVDVDVAAARASWADRSLGRVTARIHGAARRPHVAATLEGADDAEHVEASARFDLEALTLRNAEATVRRNAVEVGVEAPLVRLDGPSVPELKLTGVGAPIDASFRLRGDGFEASVDAERIDLARISRLLPQNVVPIRGQGIVDVHVRRRAGRFDGTIRLVGEDVVVGENPPGSLAVGLELKGREIRGLLGLRVPGLGELSVSALPLRLGAFDLTRPRAWTDATGRVSVQGTLDAAGVAKRAHALGGPDLEPDGAVALQLDVQRERASLPPSLHLAWGLRGHPSSGIRELSSSGLVELDAASEQLGVEVAVDDPEGTLARFDLEGEIPWRRWWATGFAPPEGWLAGLRDRPMKAWLNTWWRDVDAIPFDLPTLGGRVRIPRAFFSGTLDDPHLGVEIEVDDFAPAAAQLRHPLDVYADLSWFGDRAHAAVSVGRRERLTGRVSLNADLMELVAGEVEWDASARVEARGVPLALFQSAVDAEVGGRLFGTVDVDALGTSDPSAEAALSLRGLRLGEVALPEASVDATAEGGDMELAVDVAGDGEMHLEATADTPWSSLVPDFEGTQKATVHLDLDRFPVGAAQPWVRSILPEIAGRIDADVDVEVAERSSYEGSISLREGRFHIASFGEEFFDTEADLHFEKGELQLDRLAAKSLDGVVYMSGSAKWNGLDFDSAALAADIADPIPVVVDGTSYGTVEGDVRATAVPENGGLRFDVTVPDLLVRLPDRLPSGVQSLGVADHVQVGTRHDGRRIEVALGPGVEEDRKGMPIFIGLDLGEVEVRKGEMLRAFLSEGPDVEITDRTRMTGSVVITGGTLQIQGREFELQQSRVNFTGRPPENPEILATAKWNAPDGTEVIAKYQGPLLDGSLELRSSPAMTKNQILTLLAFGSTDGATGGEDGASTAGQAVGLGGSVAAQGLNAAIDDLTSLDVRANVAQREGGTATELEVRIARSVSLQLGHILGIGSRLSRQAQRNYAAVEWQFAHHWSLEAKVGDQGGTSLDLLWRRRY